MGKPSRDKGARTERTIVNACQEAGFAAERIPLSGAAGGKFSGDVSIPLCGEDTTWEVKCRADGFRELYKWLGGNHGLIVKADRQTPLAVIPLWRFLEIAAAAERGRATE